MRPSRLTWVVLAALLVLQLALVVSLVGRRDAQPHGVPLTVQGPAVVAQEIAGRLNRLPGDPVHAVVRPESSDPRALVRNGEAAAALVVDLTLKDNVLLVSSVNDPELNRLLRSVAAGASRPMQRGYQAQQVAPLHHAGLARSTLYLLGGLWIVVGFLIAVGWLVLPRVRQREPYGRARSAVALAAVSLGVSLVVAGIATAMDAGSFGTLWALGFVATYATALSTVALEVLFGIVGLAVASTLFLVVTGPVFSARDPRLLPTPWWLVDPWTPHGASLALMTSVSWFDSSGVLRPALVLAGVIVLSLVALGSARRLRASPAPASGQAHWRLQVLAIAVPTALALVAAVLLAPAGGRIVSAERVPGAAETECIPTPAAKVTNVKSLNDYVDTVRAGSSFQGADVGADVLLQDGRRLWVFADTLRAPDFRGEQFVRNSMLVFSPTCLETVLPADHGALIPDRGDGIGYWPMSIARIQRDGYDLVGVATQRVKATSAPDGIFAFETLGPSMAVFVVERGKTPQLIAQRDIGPDKVDTTRPMWGAAAAVSGGWAYLYGTARPAAKGIFGYSLQVARTRPENLLDPGSWRYWDGKAWQKSAARAATLIPSDGGVSQTLSVFERHGRWYAVSKRNEVLGTDLVVWTAPSPTGPWDSGTKVADLPSDPTTGELRYMPLAHPDLIADQLTVLVSYSRNNTDAKTIQDDPFLYRPQFVRVSLPR